MIGNTTFGSSTANATNQPSSFFGTPQQPQQPQQQGTPALLSLQSAFPDTNVPYFIIRPDGINRTTLPSSALNDRAISSSTNAESTTSSGKTFYYKGKETTIFESINAQSQLDGPNKSSSSTGSPTSRNYQGKRKVLPGFLTGSSAQVTLSYTHAKDLTNLILFDHTDIGECESWAKALLGQQR